ncbi:hypothetical protein L1987_10044 [Smallanthus sonchifolius]|uniref:Uncharacterized protein n=1 Tax=Smallanthus sonchifolius TaxID=185202 RepID=A0ACB9JRD2_9ASTR|nr:hypothetical protein L1987_10044 [Smallanthus sonchifolius]
MAACNIKAIQVNCCAQKPSSVTTFEQFKKQLLSSFQPFIVDLQKIPIKLVAPHAIIKKTSIELLHTFTDSVFHFIDHQSFPSQSNFGPVEEIGESVYVIDVQGTIPSGFPEGVYIRNEGEGMLHALCFKKESNGKWSVSYNNKHVEMDTLKMEKQRNTPSFLPAIEGDSAAILSAYLLNFLRFGMVNKLLSNTSVFEHSGKFYAAAEIHLPQEINIRTLNTLGNWDVNGSWNRPFTAHPKDPFNDGSKLVHKADLKFKRCSICHDIGVTVRYNVILDLPLTIDIKRLANGGPLIKYDKEGHARIGVMPRYGNANSLRWFQVEPCCVFHIINTYEDDDEVILWAFRARNSIIPGPDLGLNKFEWFSSRFKHECDTNFDSDESFISQAYEWRLNMKTGEVKERFLTGKSHSMDFPMINESFTGLKNKYGYAQTVDLDASTFSGMPKFGGLVKLYLGDTKQQDYVKMEHHKLPKNTFCTGATFVAKPGGTEEDDGWVITFVHDEQLNISRVIIVDAKNFTSEPVAIITLPSRVPYGFHGAFMPIIL